MDDLGGFSPKIWSSWRSFNLRAAKVLQPNHWTEHPRPTLRDNGGWLGSNMGSDIEKHIISEKNISVFKEKKCVSWWKIVMLKNQQIRNAYEEQGGKTTSVDDHKASSLNTTWHDDRNAKHVLAKIRSISNSNSLWVSAHLEVSQTRIHNFPMPRHKRSIESSRFSTRAWLWKVASKGDELFNKISTKIDDWDWFLR